MRRLSLVLLPFLAAFALVFGMSYLWRGVVYMRNGAMVPAGLSLVFGVVGVGLAVSLWVTRRRARSGNKSSGQSA